MWQSRFLINPKSFSLWWMYFICMNKMDAPFVSVRNLTDILFWKKKKKVTYRVLFFSAHQIHFKIWYRNKETCGDTNTEFIIFSSVLLVLKETGTKLLFNMFRLWILFYVKRNHHYKTICQEDKWKTA